MIKYFKYFIINIILIQSLSASQPIHTIENTDDCVKVVSYINENIDTIDSADLLQFLKSFSNDHCINNVEFSEWGNEVLFLLMERRPQVFFGIINQLNSRELKALQFQTNNPVSDLIDMKKIADSIMKSEMSDELKTRAMDFISIALEKYIEQNIIKKEDTSITCSSVLTGPNQQKDYYGSQNLFDGSEKTAWVEGAKGDGIGEWILFDFNSSCQISGLRIQAGYFASKSTYSNNNRVKEIELIYSDGLSESLNFSDIMEWQYKSLSPRITKSVKLIIKDVYNGSNYQDTCISGIQIWGNKSE